MVRFLATLAVATAALAATSATAAAVRPGSLETRIASFFGDKIQAVAVTPDRRILAAGAVRSYPATRSWVRAYLSDGSPDAGFGDNGVVVFDADFREVVAMAVQPDGRSLVGQTGIPARLHRLNRDGSPDASFGAGGTLTTDFGGASYESLTDVALQPDGRLLVVGVPYGPAVGSGAPPKSLQLERYLSDGSTDRTFGTDGRVTLPTGDPNVWDAALGLQPGGRIVVAVRRYPGGLPAIARLSADGALDPAFGRGGLAPVEVGRSRWADDAQPTQGWGWHPLTLPDGRIRIPIRFGRPPERPSRMAVLGLSADGHPDGRFGFRGLALAPPPDLSSSGESPETAILDAAGGIVVAGSGWSGGDLGGDDAGLIRRFRADGTPDASFGDHGLVRGPLQSGGYSVFEQRLALLDRDTLVASENEFDGKYGGWGAGALRTLHAGYDHDPPSLIVVVRDCRSVRVRARDAIGVDRVLVRADGRVVRRTQRRRFGVRFRRGVRRISVVATDLAGNEARSRMRLPRC